MSQTAQTAAAAPEAVVQWPLLRCSRMPDIDIRRAQPADLNGLTASCAALFAEDGGTRDALRNAGWPGEHGAAWIAELSVNPDALLLAAVAADGVAGHLVGIYEAASPMWLGARAELVSMYVRPSLRGGGIGSQLVADFTAWARERGASRAHVTAYAANDGAVRFYQRHGFAPFSTVLATDL
jgi:GNAT superfamily N-acetyltransferase